MFVEVKARAKYDDAVEAVTEHQRRRIIAAAEFWLAQRPQDVQGDVRFDVVLVTPGRIPQHLPGAFDASSCKLMHLTRQSICTMIGLQ